LLMESCVRRSEVVHVPQANLRSTGGGGGGAGVGGGC